MHKCIIIIEIHKYCGYIDHRPNIGAWFNISLILQAFFRITCFVNHLYIYLSYSSKTICRYDFFMLQSIIYSEFVKTNDINFIKKWCNNIGFSLPFFFQYISNYLEISFQYVQQSDKVHTTNWHTCICSIFYLNSSYCFVCLCR